MKKIYLLLTAAFILCFNFLHAQIFKNIGKLPIKPHGNFTQKVTTSYCDTGALDISDFNLYVFNMGANGFASGTNNQGVNQMAGYFDYSASADTYINAVIMHFAFANSNKPANLSRTLSFNIYSSSGGVPGTLLYTATKTLGDIKPDVDAETYTAVTISPGIAMPVSKKFFVVVDFSNLSWSASAKDSAAIFTASTYNTNAQAFGKYNGIWYSFSDLYELDFAIDIHPITSTAPACSLLPLHLLSFNIQKQNTNALLSWTVENEQSMKQYELQRASSNLLFTTIQTIAANNSMSKHTYNAIDKYALIAHKGDVYYRLKQVNKDGSFTYSKVISANTADNGIIINVRPNPFTGTLSMQINAEMPSAASFRIFDMQGRSMGIQKQINLAAGEQSIEIPGTSSLRPGTYLVDVVSGDKHVRYKVVKQ